MMGHRSGPARRRLVPGLLALWTVLLPGPAHAASAGLARALEDALAATRAPGALWGVAVANLADGSTVFATNAHRLFIPASNTKLFTAACALDRLGPDWTAPTRFLSDGLPDGDGVLRGDLIIAGGGDPGFGGRSIGEPSADFQRLVTAIRDAGVRRVDGDLVVAEGWFEAGPYGSGWGWDDIPEGYGAAVSAAVAYRNAAWVRITPGADPGTPAGMTALPWNGVFQLAGGVGTGTSGIPPRVRLARLPGSVVLHVSGQIAVDGAPYIERMAVPDPGRWFGECLADALRRSGIPVSGQVRAVPDVPAATELGRVRSAPLSEMAGWCLKPSDNLLAQLLLLQVGRDVRENPRAGDRTGGGDDESRGAQAVEAFLAGMGIGPESFVIEEGSGLSRKNLATPDATVRLLRHMDAHPAGAAWRAALPVGGVDGTLASRFSGPSTRGRVSAKTGTLRYVNALSGYVTTAGGERLAFAILVNGYRSADPAASGRAEIDRIVGILADWGGTPR